MLSCDYHHVIIIIIMWPRCQVISYFNRYFKMGKKRQQNIDKILIQSFRINFISFIDVFVLNIYVNVPILYQSYLQVNNLSQAVHHFQS